MRSTISQALPTPPPLHLPSTPPSPPSQDDLKHLAAHKAMEMVKSHTVLGLGTGSTADHFLLLLADSLNRGVLTNVVGVPTSLKTHSRAVSLGIPLSDLASHPVLDLSVDGADEVDPDLNLVKGRGGSLLREKMIESASKSFVVIIDETKLVERIGGSGGAVPVEVVPFGWELTMRKIKAVFDDGQCEAKLRTKRGPDGEGEVPFETDNANYVVDLYFEDGIEADLEEVSDALLRITGVVEHGMFLGLASKVIVAGPGGITVKARD